jgi:hypothetical protein
MIFVLLVLGKNHIVSTLIFSTQLRSNLKDPTGYYHSHDFREEETK